MSLCFPVNGEKVHLQEILNKKQGTYQLLCLPHYNAPQKSKNQPQCSQSLLSLSQGVSLSAQISPLVAFLLGIKSQVTPPSTLQPCTTWDPPPAKPASSRTLIRPSGFSLHRGAVDPSAALPREEQGSEVGVNSSPPLLTHQLEGGGCKS